jgi:ABC-type dipeptide/oligopeptide/nickel transport system ATPase component
VPLLGAAENIAMTITDRIARFGFVGPGAVRRGPHRWPGGNQHKVTVAQALASDSVLIVATTSTRSVDVASKELLLSELDRITTVTGASLPLAGDVRQAMPWVDVVRITMQFPY